MAFSQLTIIGNVGRDPELTYTPNGIAVCKFSVAVSKRSKDGKDETTWYNCVAWRQSADTLNQYVHKGDQLFVQGELSPRVYTTKDGKMGVSLDVTVDKFSFIGKRQAQEQATATDGLGDLDHPF